MFKIKRTKNKTVVSEDLLLIKVLRWAYDRGSRGFLMSELYDAVAATQKDKMWIGRMMMGEINGEPHLIMHMGSRHTGGEYLYFITSTGATTLIDYLELKEARESSKEAKKIATWSIGIAIVVGIFQILASWKDLLELFCLLV